LVEVGLGPEISVFVNILANAENRVFDFGLFVALLVERDAGHADAVVAGILLNVFYLGIWVNFGNFSVNLGAIVAQGLLGLRACSVWVEAVGGGADLDFNFLGWFLVGFFEWVVLGGTG